MRNRKGFTLIELMIVTIIIGVLASIAAASYSSVREKAMVETARSEVRNAITASERYRAVHGVLPTSLQQLLDANFHARSANVDFCQFAREDDPQADLVIEAAHRGSTVHLLARYPSAGVTLQEINADADCS